MNKNALVTGSTRGIGLATALRLAELGYRVILHGRSHRDNFISTTNMANKPNHSIVYCDLSNPEKVRELSKELHSFDLDILVNCAGATLNKLLLRTTESEIMENFHVNCVAPIILTKSALKRMIAKKSGCIVNVSSIIAMHATGNVGQSIYSSSKSALIGFTKSIAREYGPIGIRCNAVAPGFIDTDMTKEFKKDFSMDNIPLRRFGTTNEVADAIMFLINNPYMNGQTINIDGGISA